MGPKGRGKGKNFTSSELDTMLIVVEKLLPMGGDHWDQVTMEYNKKVSADRIRNAESLRKKFKTLRNVKKPDCPIEVKRAKRAQYSIEAKMGIETLESGDENDEDGKMTEESSSEDDGDGGANVEVCTTNDDEGQPPPAKESKPPPNPKTQSAALNRVGYTSSEILEMGRSTSSMSPTLSNASSPSSSTKRSIDNVLQDLSSMSTRQEPEGFMSYTEMMMLQRQDDARREERAEELRRERDAIRRQEAREAEERQERRDERREEAAAKRDAIQMQMMMTFIASMKEK